MELSFLKELNKEQYLAATTFEGPLLILAGAGSGKTKTLIARTANMIAHNISGDSILIMTFTNKAAKEMKERGQKLLSEIEYEGPMPTFTTFHSWGLNFLKSYVRYNKDYPLLTDNFTIADENVQKKIIKDLIKELFKENPKFKEGNFSALSTIFQNNLIPYSDVKETYEKIQELIDKKKKEGKFLTLLKDNNIETKRDIRKFSELYIKYKEILRENNLADFDDLINLTIDILRKDENVRSYIHRKYNFIMVDEFQDTNWAQINLLNLILNKNKNICVVGDDSQSIYGWRGAEIDFILSFHTKYEDVLKINLKKNYRSTKDIVSHANKLIENADEKHEFKEALEAFKKEKGKVLSRMLENEFDEARMIAMYIKELLLKKVKPSDIAVLYRNNFIARTIEKELIKSGVPYKIFKGRSLLQKKAVQELMNHIFLLINPENSVALESCLTSTSKILSPKKLDEMKKSAYEKKMDLSEYIFGDHWKEVKLSKPQRDRLSSFIISTLTTREEIVKGILVNEEFLNVFYEKFSLIKEYERIAQESTSIKTREQAEKALEDINNMSSVIMSYQTLYDFVDAISLDSETEESEDNKVNLMTIHASKGLEFSYVFLARMNQGVIPSTRSLASPALIEEERRLAYVAITRAKKFLHISYIRRQRNEIMTPSMFLYESKIIKKKNKYF